MDKSNEFISKEKVMAALAEKVERNWLDYQTQLTSWSPLLIFNRAREITATEQAREELLSGGYPRDALEYLLRFENPLEVVRDQWLDENNTGISNQFGHALWNLMDKRDADQCYDLDPVFAAEAEPGVNWADASQDVPAMSIDTFWESIERAKRHMDSDGSIALALGAELKKHSLDDSVMFGQIYDVYHKLSDRWLLWCAGNLFNEGLSDDGFHYFRSWLIGRGRDAFYEVMSNPDSLAYYDKLGTRHDQAWAEKREQGSRWKGEILSADDEGAEYAASRAYEKICKKNNLQTDVDYDTAFDKAYDANPLPAATVQAIIDSVSLHPHINLRIENAEQAAEFLPLLKAKCDDGSFIYNRWAHPVEVDGLPYELPDKYTHENEQQMG